MMMMMRLWILVGLGGWCWRSGGADSDTLLYTWQSPEESPPVNHRDDGNYGYSSACANGGGGSVFGFPCPHMMLLSSDMVAAAQRDGLSGDFLYAVGSTSSDDDCGKCYQVQLLDGEREFRSNYSQWIVQIVNSGYDVLSLQLDVFMGAGGFGYFTAVNRDCSSQFCQGGPCKAAMFDSDFSAWNRPLYSDQNPCYSGGVKRMSNDPSIESMCRGLDADNRRYLSDNITIESCIRSNREALHQNFVSSMMLRVQCPESLVRLTGLQRADEYNNPYPSVGNSLPQQCRGDRSQGHYCITTMMDGCIFSCSWLNKGYATRDFARVYVCHKDGSILS